MPSRKPYGCVFCPTYLLAFLVVFFFLAGALFFAFARGFAVSFASAFAVGAGAAGAATPATRISTWLVRFRIGVPPAPGAPREPLRRLAPLHPPQGAPRAAPIQRACVAVARLSCVRYRA